MTRAAPFPPGGAAPQAPLPLDLPRPSGRRSGARGCGGEGAAHRVAPSPELRERLVEEVLAESAVVVTRVDPPGEGTRARWYRVALQPAFGGGIHVIRSWGRLPVGRRPRRLVTRHDTDVEAATAVRAVVDRRLRRGYGPAGRRDVRGGW